MSMLKMAKLRTEIVLNWTISSTSVRFINIVYLIIKSVVNIILLQIQFKYEISFNKLQIDIVDVWTFIIMLYVYTETIFYWIIFTTFFQTFF